MSAILTGMEARSYRLTDKAPPGASICGDVEGIMWVHARENDFEIVECLRWGWVEEVQPPERFDDEWDFEVSVESTPMTPFAGNEMSVAAAVSITLRLVKGHEEVLTVSGIKGSALEANPALLNEMLQRLNGNWTD